MPVHLSPLLLTQKLRRSLCYLHCWLKKQPLMPCWEYPPPTLCSARSCSLHSSDKTPTWGCSPVTTGHRPNNKQAQQWGMHRRNSQQQTAAFPANTIKETIYKRCDPQAAPFAKLFQPDISLSPAAFASPTAASDPAPGSATKPILHILHFPHHHHNSCTYRNLAAPTHALPGQLPNAAPISHTLLMGIFSCFSN